MMSSRSDNKSKITNQDELNKAIKRVNTGEGMKAKKMCTSVENRRGKLDHSSTVL